MDRDLIKTLVSAIRQADARQTTAYDTQATVTRVEGNTAWVHIPGGVSETPVRMTVDCRQGDTVQVRVGGGRAHITGNATAPPTDNTLARTVQGGLTATRKVLASVKKTAESAARIATNTAQYFWTSTGGSDNGAHVTSIPQEQFEADPSNGGGNLLMTTNGVAVRDGLTELATFGADGVVFGDDDGECFSLKRSTIDYSRYNAISAENALAMQAKGELELSEALITMGASATDSGGVVRRASEIQLSATYTPTVGDPISARIALEAGNDGNVRSIIMSADEVTFASDKVTVRYNAPIVKDTFSDLGKSANTYYYQKTFNVAKSGYTPIAFNPYTNHATEAACMVHYNAGDATVTVMSRNSTISDLNLYLDVTYARNELL